MSSSTVLRSSGVHPSPLFHSDAVAGKKSSRLSSLLCRKDVERERRLHLRNIGVLGRAPRVAPRYSRAAHELERAIIANNLEHRLSLRASVEELVARGVLSAGTTAKAARAVAEGDDYESMDAPSSGINSDGFYVVEEDEVAEAKASAKRAARALDLHLRRVASAEARRDQRRDLEARNILMTGTSTEHEKFSDRKRRLERAIAADCLEHRLSLRPSPQELLHSSSTARRSSQEILLANNETFRANEVDANRAATLAVDRYYLDAKAALERELATADEEELKARLEAARARAMEQCRRRLSAQLARDKISRSLEWDIEARRASYADLLSRRSYISREDAEAAAAKLSELMFSRAHSSQNVESGEPSAGGSGNTVELAARQRSVGCAVAKAMLARSGAFAGGTDSRAARRRELEGAGVVRSRMEDKARQLERRMAGREVGKVLRQMAAGDGGAR